MGQSDRGDELYFHADPPRRVVVHVDVPPPAQFTGTWTTYYVNGAVYESVELDHGNTTRAREMHDNGQVREENVYVDGRREGHVVTYFADGKPEWDQTYAKGELVGEERWYWPNGKLREQRHWKNGKQDGRTKIYGEGGGLNHCIEYRDGVSVGDSCGDDAK
jgi:antitoxin component YwqK of YwqJK toxin-antitoxin module